MGVGERAGDPVYGCLDEMLEAAVWIGIVLSGVAVLGAIEFVRSRAFVKNRSFEIKSGLPIVGLLLLFLITGSVSVVFFFLYFLAAFWKFSLAIIFLVFIFLVVRIRKEQTLGALVAQTGTAAGKPTSPPTLFNRVATLAMEAAGAALLMVFLVPFAAGGFFLFRFYSGLLNAIGIGALNPVLPCVLILVTILIPYYFIMRWRRPPA